MLETETEYWIDGPLVFKLTADDLHAVIAWSCAQYGYLVGGGGGGISILITERRVQNGIL